MTQRPRMDLILRCRICPPTRPNEIDHGVRSCEPEECCLFNSLLGPEDALATTRDCLLADFRGEQTWPTQHLPRSVLFDCIEGFYSPLRTQKRLGDGLPAESEAASVA